MSLQRTTRGLVTIFAIIFAIMFAAPATCQSTLLTELGPQTLSTETLRNDSGLQLLETDDKNVSVSNLPTAKTIAARNEILHGVMDYPHIPGDHRMWPEKKKPIPEYLREWRDIFHENMFKNISGEVSDWFLPHTADIFKSNIGAHTALPAELNTVKDDILARTKKGLISFLRRKHKAQKTKVRLDEADKAISLMADALDESFIKPLLDKYKTWRSRLEQEVDIEFGRAKTYIICRVNETIDDDFLSLIKLRMEKYEAAGVPDHVSEQYEQLRTDAGIRLRTQKLVDETHKNAMEASPGLEKKAPAFQRFILRKLKNVRKKVPDILMDVADREFWMNDGLVIDSVAKETSNIVHENLVDLERLALRDIRQIEGRIKREADNLVDMFEKELKKVKRKTQKVLIEDFASLPSYNEPPWVFEPRRLRAIQWSRQTWWNNMRKRNANLCLVNTLLEPMLWEWGMIIADYPANKADEPGCGLEFYKRFNKWAFPHSCWPVSVWQCEELDDHRLYLRFHTTVQCGPDMIANRISDATDGKIKMDCRFFTWKPMSLEDRPVGGRGSMLELGLLP